MDAGMAPLKKLFRMSNISSSRQFPILREIEPVKKLSFLEQEHVTLVNI
jgi:hypothetical protein